MKQNFDKHRDVWGPLLSVQLALWGEFVFKPASTLIDNEQMSLQQFGEVPSLTNMKGSGKYFSTKGIELKLLNEKPFNYSRVKYFDYAAAEYEVATHTFKQYLVDKVFAELSKYIKEDFRIVDCACGPGYESIMLSAKVPKGEVVSIDLSVEMINLACKNAKNQHIKNMSFYQADVQQLPQALNNKFDMVYCQLNCSYFDDMYVVARSFYKMLCNHGFVVLVEPYPNLSNTLSINIIKEANPFFKRFYTKEDMHSFFITAGFNNFYWKEIMPGFGLSIITKNNIHV